MKMPNSKRNLIKILEQNSNYDMCVELTCANASCDGCPFDDEGSLVALIDELKNNYICSCRKCGTKFSTTHTNCPICNELESVRLL